MKLQKHRHNNCSSRIMVRQTKAHFYCVICKMRMPLIVLFFMHYRIVPSYFVEYFSRWFERTTKCCQKQFVCETSVATFIFLIFSRVFFCCCPCCYGLNIPFLYLPENCSTNVYIDAMDDHFQCVFEMMETIWFEYGQNNRNLYAWFICGCAKSIDANFKCMSRNVNSFNWYTLIYMPAYDNRWYIDIGDDSFIYTEFFFFFHFFFLNYSQ